MTYHTRAVYRGGAFVPATQCELPENSEVDLLVQGPLVVRPTVTDPAERTRILRQVTERMKGNPIPAGAPRLTRDQLHERG
jgi:hypothetical protein